MVSSFSFLPPLEEEERRKRELSSSLFFFFPFLSPFPFSPLFPFPFFLSIVSSFPFHLFISSFTAISSFHPTGETFFFSNYKLYFTISFYSFLFLIFFSFSLFRKWTYDPFLFIITMETNLLSLSSSPSPSLLSSSFFFLPISPYLSTLTLTRSCLLTY